MEACNANGEWLTNMAAGDDNNDVPMMHAVHGWLNDLQSIYLDDFEIVSRASAAALCTTKRKADKSGSRHG